MLTLLIGLSGLTLVALPKLLTPSTVDNPEVGKLVPEDIRAPHALDVVDEESSGWTRKQAQAQVRSVYDRDMALEASLEARVTEAFARMREADNDSDARAELARVLDLSLDNDEFTDLRAQRDSGDIEKRVNAALRVGMSGGVVPSRDVLAPDLAHGVVVRYMGEATPREEALDDVNSVGDLTSARLAMTNALRGQTLTRVQRRVVLAVAEGVIKPNMFFNRDETERRKLSAAAEIKPVVVPLVRGERIARRGDHLTPRQVLLLKAFDAQARDTKGSARALGTSLLLATIALAALRFSRGLSRRPLILRDGVFAISALIAQMLLVRAVHFALSFWDPSSAIPYEALMWAAPFAAGPLLVRLFLAEQVGLVVGLVSAVAASLMFEGNLTLLLYVVAGSLIAATTSRRPLSLVRVGLEITLAQAAVALCSVVLGETPLAGQIAWICLAPLVSGLGTVFLCALVTPVIEAIFGFTTELRLRELAALDHPLLKHLIVAAPGTYHHSVVMGAMVEAAAEEIGADPLLAKVGAYFHDIGKLEHPQLYRENRRQSSDDLGLGEESLETVRHHVDHGAALARKARLGQSVLAIITSHHGTRSVGRTMSTPRVLAYKGPRPYAKEAALVMMADAVESSVREAGAAKPAEVSARVDEVAETLFREGQLDESELQLSSLPLIKAAFVRTLLRVRRAEDGQQLWVVHDSDRGNDKLGDNQSDIRGAGRGEAQSAVESAEAQSLRLHQKKP